MTRSGPADPRARGRLLTGVWRPARRGAGRLVRSAMLVVAPHAYCARRGLFNAVADDALRRALQQEARRLSWRDRLRLASPLTRTPPSLDDFLDRRFRRAPDGEPYFDTGTARIFFRPARVPEDDADMLHGARLVLREAFVRRCDFFHGPVRIAPGAVVIDGGASFGTSALVFSRLAGPDGRVHSFEPLFADLLRRNLHENDARNVEVIAAALGDSSGEATFTRTRTGIDSRLSSAHHDEPPVRVPMLSLDAYASSAGLDRVDFIKLDVEGAEELVLEGGADLIRRCRPKLTIASYHTDPTGEPQHPKLVRLLASWGYHVEEMGSERIYAH